MGIIDGLASLLKSILSDSGRAGEERPDSRGYRDPDLNEAMEELDEFLRAGTSGKNGGERQGQASPLEGLRQDYANLEVPFGADIETVKRAYKTLILHYHPDKHAGDPEKLRIATEITKKINESFERIRSQMEK